MSDVLELLVVFQISVGGAPLDDSKRDSLLDAVVEQSSELPDACTLRFSVSVFQDDGEALLATSVFPEGAALKVEARNMQSSLATLFEGEIVGVELDLSTFGPSTLTVRGLHAAHRLMRGQKQLTFLDQSDGDIFTKVVAGAGLTATDNSASKTVYPYTIQDNLTDWEFLQLLARRNGSRVSCGGDKKVVFDGFSSQTGDVSVKWAEDLLSFRPRTHAAGQIDSVEVRGWDPKTKQAVVGTANDTSLGVPSAGTTVGAAKKDWSAAKHYLTNQAVVSQAEATALATSTLRRLRGRFLQMEALCEGNPDIEPGKNLKVDNVGSRFNGKYPITSAVHTFSPSEGYRTQVFSSGRDPEGLLPALAGGGSAQAPFGEGMGFGSFAVGIVTNNQDPDKLGRVKVKFPALSEAQESFWCRIVSQMAGSGRGFFNLPEVNDEVLVGFEQGSPHLPYVLGQLWNGTDKPPVLAGGSGGGSLSSGPSKPAKDDEVADGKVDRRGYYTRIGHKLDFSDKDSKGYVWLQTAAANELALSDADEGIWLKTPGGHWFFLSDQHKGIKVHSSGGHTVYLDDQGKKIEIKDSGGNVITMDATGGKISMKANVEINLAAPTINIKADAQLNAESPKTSVKGEATLQLEGALATLKGEATTQVQASGVVIVQGGLVKIN